MAPSTGRLRRLAITLTTLLTAALLLPVPAGAVPERTTAELTAADLDTWLDGLIPALLEREGIPGASIGVVHEGEVLTLRGFGHADLGDAKRDPVPMDPQQTLLRVGSVSKTVVAIAAMQLVERDQLDLDEPVAAHLDLELDTSFDEPITMRHLLTHTAGFEEVLRDLITTDPASAPGLREYLVAEMPEQIYEPGTVPAYSNYGYALAGYVIERISGQDAADYLRTQVLEPAGAATASFAQPLPDPLADRAASVYPSTHGEPIGFETVAPYPAGSMSASAADLSALMLALLDPEDSPLLGAEALETLQAAGLSEQELGNLAAGPQMALGLFEEDRHGHRILGHPGDTIHSHAAFQIYPEHGTGIVIGMNGTGIRADSPTVLRSELLSGFADRYFPPEDGTAAAPTETAEERAAAVAGQYTLARAGESTFLRVYSMLTAAPVTAQGEQLLIPTLADSSGKPIPLTETEPWVFEDETGTHRVAVRADENGQVEAISLMPGFTLLPAPAWTTPLLVAFSLSLVILVIAVLAWPVRAVVGRRLGAPLQLARTDRRLRRVTLVLAVVAVVSAALWTVAAMLLLSSGGSASATLLRGAQVTTLLGALGTVPAIWRTVRAWGQRSWLPAVAATLVALAFIGVTAFALTGGLLLPDLSY